jgi:hypothetical protein
MVDGSGHGVDLGGHGVDIGGHGVDLGGPMLTIGQHKLIDIDCGTIQVETIRH